MAWVKNRFEVFIRVNQAAVKAYTDSPGGQIQPHFLKQAEAVAARARQLVSGEMVNSVTGKLRDSIGVRPKYIGGRGWVYDVEASDPKAAFIHSGTRPHFIPRNGKGPKVLKFTAGSGEILYRDEVLHPGTRARPFLHTALREVTGSSPFF